MNEVDFLMRVESGGIATHEGLEGYIAQLDEWLNTPRGTVYGNPTWGNRFFRYKHQPTDESMGVIIENEIIFDLRRDLPDVPLAGIRCDPDGIQDYSIQFLLGNEIIKRGVKVK